MSRYKLCSVHSSWKHFYSLWHKLQFVYKFLAYPHESVSAHITVSLCLMCSVLNCVIFQLVREEHEHSLAKSSFATDDQIFAELDSIAGTTGAKTYKREVFMQFLQSKWWKIEIPDVKPSAPSVTDSELEELVPVGPKQDMVFQSSSENPVKCQNQWQRARKMRGKMRRRMTMTPARAEEPFAPATPAMETYRLSVPPARKPDLTMPFYIVTHYYRSLLHSCKSQVLQQKTLPTR